MIKPLLIFSIAALMAASCGHHHTDESDHHDHEHEHNHEHAAAAATAHDHAGEIEVHDAVAERFGVRVDSVRRGEFHSVCSAGGAVLASSEADGVVSSPTAGVVSFVRGIGVGSHVGRGALVATVDSRGTTGGDANATAAAELAAARREYERIEALYKDQLATVGERNAALAAYERAKAAYSPAAAAGRAVSPISGTVTELLVRQGQYVGVGEPVATVVSASELTLRIDVPQRHYVASAADAVVKFPYADSPVRLSEIGGRRVSADAVAPSGAASSFVPVYFKVPAGTGILPGSTFTAKVIGAPRHGVLTLPVGALSEQQGEFFVYERVHPESYVKRRVNIGASDGINVEIISGIEEGAPVVVEGTTTVRLAESGAAIPEGHTHNH